MPECSHSFTDIFCYCSLDMKECVYPECCDNYEEAKDYDDYEDE